MPGEDASDAIDILALVKSGERYVLMFNAATRAEALRALGRWAGNQELSFTWYDAGVLSHRVRELAAMDDYKPPERFSYE